MLVKLCLKGFRTRRPLDALAHGESRLPGLRQLLAEESALEGHLGFRLPGWKACAPEYHAPKPIRLGRTELSAHWSGRAEVFPVLSAMTLGRRHPDLCGFFVWGWLGSESVRDLPAW